MLLGSDYQGMVLLVVGFLKSVYVLPGVSLWLLHQLSVWGVVGFVLVRKLVSGAGVGGG